MVETIEIVMRKIEEWGSVSETVLVSLPSTGSPEIIQSPYVLTFPGLKIRIQEQTVYHNDTLIPLTHHEFFNLTYLASHPSWVFSKEQIYEAVWKEPGTNCGSAVTNVVSQIRRKIGDGY